MANPNRLVYLSGKLFQQGAHEWHALGQLWASIDNRYAATRPRSWSTMATASGADPPVMVDPRVDDPAEP
jgi:hypothetical protein